MTETSDSGLLAGLDSDEPIRSRFDKPSRPAVSDKALQQVKNAVLYSMVHRPFSMLSRGLTPSDWRIEGFRSRFYRQFNAKTDAVEDALLSAISPNRSKLTDGLVAEMNNFATIGCEPGEASDGSADMLPSDAVSALGDAYFAQSIGDDVLVLQMLAWVCAGEQQSIKDDFPTLYDSLDQRTVNGLSTMLGAWGRTPIEPFTWSDIATTLTALTEGLLIRHAVDPEKVDTKFLGQVAIGVVSSMTRHESEDVEHVRDRLDL